MFFFLGCVILVVFFATCSLWGCETGGVRAKFRLVPLMAVALTPPEVTVQRKVCHKVFPFVVYQEGIEKLLTQGALKF